MKTKKNRKLFWKVHSGKVLDARTIKWIVNKRIKQEHIEKLGKYERGTITLRIRYNIKQKTKTFDMKIKKIEKEQSNSSRMQE